jgi:hypothetical protein
MKSTKVLRIITYMAVLFLGAEQAIPSHRRYSKELGRLMYFFLFLTERKWQASIGYALSDLPEDVTKKFR